MSVTTRTGHRVPAHEGPAGNGLRALVRTHPLLSYFAVTFLISWGGLLLLMALGPGRMPLTSEEFDPLLPFALLVTVAGPAVAGPLLAGLADGRAGLREFRARLARWRAAPRWYAAALLGGPLAVVAALLPLSLISTDFLPAIVTTENKGGLLLAGLAAGVAAGVLEETGWTGFAVPRLRVHHGVVAAGLLLGMVWGVWHFPVYAAGSGTPTGGLAWEVFGPPAVFFVTVLPVFRVLMIMVYDRVASVPVAMIMHGSLSATAPLILAPQVTGAALATFYVTVAVVLWVVVAAVGIAKRRRPTPSSPGRTPSPSAHAQW